MRHICALLKTRLEIGTEMFHKQLAENDTPAKDCDGNSHDMMQKDDQYCEEKPALSATPSMGVVPSPDDGKSNEGKVEGGNCSLKQCFNSYST